MRLRIPAGLCRVHIDRKLAALKEELQQLTSVDCSEANPPRTVGEVMSRVGEIRLLLLQARSSLELLRATPDKFVEVESAEFLLFYSPDSDDSSEAILGAPTDPNQKGNHS